jgi:glucose 1-dehydrogenase
MRLKDKVALITGANSGIGRAIADRFAAEGAHVAVNYLPGPHDAEVRAQVAGYATEGLPVAADVSKRDQVERMVAAVVQKFGRLDIVVSNAGIEIRADFQDVTDDQWHRVLGVNLYGSFVVAQAGVRQMLAQKSRGKLIFTSSVHEDIPLPGFVPYCASKGAIRMMMRTLAVELAPFHINCNNIAPGAIATPINQQVLDDPVAMKNAVSEIPWGRFGSPGEVANVALFLASDESNYVTGSTYYVDGGLTQQVTQY